MRRTISLVCLVVVAMAALSPEEKQLRKEAAQRKKQTMESCLTLVRNFYAKEESMIKQFVDIHPTTDKNRLTSKFLARMMLKCSSDVTRE